MIAAPTEELPASGPPAPVSPGGGPSGSWTTVTTGGPREGLWWPTLLLAGVLCFVTFYAKGGLNLESMTTVEMALTLAGGATVAAAVVFGPRARRVYGGWSLGLLLAFTSLTVASVVWSVQPDDSWHDGGRMLAYCAVFAVGLTLVRLAPERWPAVIGGVALAAVVVCAYALATKVLPGTLAPSNAYARLEEPFGYWNAIGLTAAMGAICCMWLGARRGGHALLSALAYPAMGLLLLTLVLAYSRGALAAFAVGAVLWLCIVPLRLRGAGVLILGGMAAGALGAWAFSTHALSAEKVPLAERVTAGHELGALIVAMLLGLTIAGVAIGFSTGRRAPSLVLRRRAGAVLLALLALALVAFLGALAHSQRGLTGSVSHAFTALTDPNAKPPSNTPDRLTAVASVRARYWKEALEVFEAHPALGAGAEGYATAHLRYRTETLSVKHAHGFVVQTLADLGLTGLVTALALLAAWLAAAGAATHPFNRRWSGWSAWRHLRGDGDGGPGWHRAPSPYTPERIGLLTILCVVVVFGMHSLIDWTWYVPGNACVALLLAGWLAGRGPLGAIAGAERTPAPRWTWPPRAPSRGAAVVAGAVLVAALLATWAQWQPQRSEESRQEALALLAHDPAGALAAADAGVSRDPLSAEALFTLANVESSTGQAAAARATLAKAVHLQPSNPQTWLELGRFDLAGNPKAALEELRAAIYLNPETIAPEEIGGPYPNAESVGIYNDYVQALRKQSGTLRTATGLR